MPRRKKSIVTRTRSFPCPDDLWQGVEAFARRRGLGSTADAARMLLRSGLATEEHVDRVEQAQRWQLAQVIAEVRRIEAGSADWADPSEVEREVARTRARMRVGAGRRRSAGA